MRVMVSGTWETEQQELEDFTECILNFRHSALKISNDCRQEGNRSTNRGALPDSPGLSHPLLPGYRYCLIFKNKNKNNQRDTGKHCKSVPWCCSDGLPGDTHFQ